MNKCGSRSGTTVRVVAAVLVLFSTTGKCIPFATSGMIKLANLPHHLRSIGVLIMSRVVNDFLLSSLTAVVADAWVDQWNP